MKTKKQVINWNKLWKEYDRWLGRQDTLYWKNAEIRIRHKIERLVEQELLAEHNKDEL